MGKADYWEGSAVEEAINYLINHKKVPMAGTSAGMAILGDYSVPAHEGVQSSEILNNPFHHNTKDIANCSRMRYTEGLCSGCHFCCRYTNFRDRAFPHPLAIRCIYRSDRNQ
jgi:hypothetical protein